MMSSEQEEHDWREITAMAECADCPQYPQVEPRQEYPPSLRKVRVREEASQPIVTEEETLFLYLLLAWHC